MEPVDVPPCSLLQGCCRCWLAETWSIGQDETTSRSLILWYCGSVVLWFCGSVALWFCGSVALWHLSRDQPRSTRSSQVPRFHGQYAQAHASHAAHMRSLFTTDFTTLSTGRCMQAARQLVTSKGPQARAVGRLWSRDGLHRQPFDGPPHADLPPPRPIGSAGIPRRRKHGKEARRQAGFPSPAADTSPQCALRWQRALSCMGPSASSRPPGLLSVEARRAWEIKTVVAVVPKSAATQDTAGPLISWWSLPNYPSHRGIGCPCEDISGGYYATRLTELPSFGLNTSNRSSNSAIFPRWFPHPHPHPPICPPSSSILVHRSTLPLSAARCTTLLILFPSFEAG